MIDKFGAHRYELSQKFLDDLYRKMEQFIADCSFEEAESNKESLNTVLTMIHHHGDKNK